ncbi:MAG: alpha/beta fold hydrolase [Azonexus sp.]|jgi:predicted alpha/beta-fold hydrolase|uniref:YheT family hydrolase n=1 Tax=Azonexus sp. TaxID=1872668 RepID=UPI0028341BAF|nr:alpha/beta fold hydrolase [Azonexus sp.]MDR0776885.1 alpha/beta fold hydrolase [Azonexus sp.]
MSGNTASPRGKRIASDYVCPRWIVGAHAQTVWPVMQARAPVAWKRERVATPDHDFWDFDWLNAPAENKAPLVILFHGLEGSSRSHYACSMMAMAAKRGWRGVVPHFRGCGGEPNLTPRAYHSGDYSEIAAILTAIRARVPEQTALYAVGVSLGGSALLNWLGRNTAADTLAAAAIVSAPIDLEQSGRTFSKGLNRVYERNFMSTLKNKALAMAKQYPGKVDPRKVSAARTLDDFDDVFTAPLHGFNDVADYRRRASSRPWLNTIGTPTLVLNALNDPLVPADSLPEEEETSPHVILEYPEEGGHAGFPTAAGTAHAWMPQRVLTFFEQHQ